MHVVIIIAIVVILIILFNILLPQCPQCKRYGSAKRKSSHSSISSDWEGEIKITETEYIVK